MWRCGVRKVARDSPAVLTALGCLLWAALGDGVWAQDIESIRGAIVRITGIRASDGARVRGTGFVVDVAGGGAAIATASHVVEGNDFDVVFDVSPFQAFSDVEILGIDLGNPNGLAVFRVSGDLPDGVTPLPVDGGLVDLGEQISLLGYPAMATSLRVILRRISGVEAQYLVLDGAVGEGLSGAPAVADDRVVGMVMATDGQQARVVNGLSVQAFLRGIRGIELTSRALGNGDPGRNSVDRPRTVGSAGDAEATERSADLRPVGDPDLVRLHGGSFLMGEESGHPDEQPVHNVRVAAFEISRTEITVAQYGACVEAGSCRAPGRTGDSNVLTSEACNWGGAGRHERPVNCVSWGDARRYAEWLGMRLPTEAEWEYAARGQGRPVAYPWGDEPGDCARAVVAFCGVGTRPVCSVAAGHTVQGVCDLAGNVLEWVEDDYHSSYEGAPDDGSAWVDSPRRRDRVLRGGSWRYDLQDARVTIRRRSVSSSRYDDVGFRVARSLR